MMTEFFVALSAIVFICVNARAETPPTSLRLRAQQEIKTEGRVQKKPSTAQVSGDSGMLSLKDPMPEIRGRRWDYYLRFDAQSFQARGRANNDLTSSDFVLNETNASVMPGLGFGIDLALGDLRAFDVHFGVGGRVAYTSVHGTARFSTGFVESDVRLNSTRVSVHPTLGLRLKRWPWLWLTGGWEYGSLNYTQTSGNKLAVFSDTVAFTGYTAGIDVRCGERWTLLAEYARRALTRPSRLDLQADNWQFGARIFW